MFYVCILAFVFPLIYVYRRFILLNFIWLCFNVYKLKRYISGLFFKPIKDSVEKNFCKIINKHIYTEYKITQDENEYVMIFVSDTNRMLYNDLVEFNKNKKDMILHKNKIVFAGITDENDQVLFDITNEFRKFCFYFDKQIGVNYFLDYFMYIQIDVDILDNYLTIYMNDEDFSQKKYSIKQISDKDFSDILS
jgi:hypothetical protein